MCGIKQYLYLWQTLCSKHHATEAYGVMLSETIQYATILKFSLGGGAMDVSPVLRDAWAAVERAELPERIHAVAFREAVRLMASERGSDDAPRSGSATADAPTGGRRSGQASNGDGVASVSEDTIYERAAEHTGVERAKLEQIVHLDDDGLRVSLPGLRLGKNNAERTRTVAQILTIVRGFGLEESETPLEVIRAECSRLKVYDSPNFSSHIGKLSGYVVSGSGQNRRLRAKAPGIQNFPALVDFVLGSS